MRGRKRTLAEIASDADPAATSSPGRLKPGERLLMEAVAAALRHGDETRSARPYGACGRAIDPVRGASRLSVSFRFPLGICAISWRRAKSSKPMSCVWS